MLAPLACALLAALPVWAAAPTKARAKAPTVKAVELPSYQLHAVPQGRHHPIADGNGAAPALAAAPLAPALAAPAPLPAAVAPVVEHVAVTLAELVDGPVAADVDVPDAGRTLFDGAVAKAKSWLRETFRPDVIPAWPGAPGQVAKLDGRSFALRDRLAEGVYAAGSDHVVRLTPPGAASERVLLEELGRTNVPHARLVAASADGRVLVTERIQGETAAELKARGYHVEHHKAGYAELAARLIESGRTADLSPGNLLWEPWRSRWTLIHPEGFKPATPADVLRQLVKGRDLEPVELLRSLRGHLGPDSPAWQAARRDGRSEPALKAHFAALERFDSRLPEPPALVFERGDTDAVFSDSIVTPKELVKRLGYEPWGEPGIQLQRDEGKLNTRVAKLVPKGKLPTVRKQASWEIIQNELVMRKIIRRWFGRWFETPGSLAVADGHESTMIMRVADGGASYYDTRMDLEQRVALALLVHTFGMHDVNENNILYPVEGRPILLDFEQALARRTANTGRIPDERIAAEMPWMTRRARNVPELYFAGARAWRELFLKDETQRELESILVSSGIKPERAKLLMAVFKANVAGLEGVIQADAEFVNRFVKGERR